MAIIDVAYWKPETRESDWIFAYKFPGTNLSTYTQLIVQESQEAVLFSKGRIIGKFGPGKHTLNTENLPVLRNLFGLPFGGKNPFFAEVWFVNKLQPYNIDWAINRMDMHDADYNTNIPLIANGRYGLKITDAERFLIKIVGSKEEFTQEHLTDQFAGEFTTKTKSAIMQYMLRNKVGLKQINAFLDDISQNLKATLVTFWENLGLELTKFYVTTIEVDSTTEVGQRVLDAISRQSAQSIGGYTWQQEQVFGAANNAIDGMSDKNSGILGAVMATSMMGGLGSGGGLMQPQYNQPAFGGANQMQQGAGTPQQATGQVKEVYCSNCSKKYLNTNRFCPHCGDEYNPCPKCGTDNDKDAKRCVSCNTQLHGEISLCSGCNAPLPPGTAFCSNCGKKQADDKCIRCGTFLPPVVKFCPKCGQKR